MKDAFSDILEQLDGLVDGLRTIQDSHVSGHAISIQAGELVERIKMIRILLQAIKIRAEVNTSEPVVYDHAHVIWIRNNATDSQISTMCKQRDDMAKVMSALMPAMIFVEKFFRENDK